MLRGKVAVVTGAGRGIGRGVALELADQGAKVVVNDYGVSVDGREPTSAPADAVVAEIRQAGGEAISNADSVAEWSKAERIIGSAVERFGRVDILVTCAGFLRDRMIFNMNEDEFDTVVGVHLKGTFNCVRHAAPLMREQRFGRIVTFSSGAGLFGNPGQANYGSAKAAISGFTKVVARDLGKYGVTANGICPVAATRMTLTPEVLKAREIRKQQGIVREESALRQLENLKPKMLRDGRVPGQRLRRQRQRAVLPLCRDVVFAVAAAAGGKTLYRKDAGRSMSWTSSYRDLGGRPEEPGAAENKNRDQ
jgi:NAD(P)-dependent dehydrogenase (short-subunit alcohol dehydrogenase family)